MSAIAIAIYSGDRERCPMDWTPYCCNGTDWRSLCEPANNEIMCDSQFKGGKHSAAFCKVCPERKAYTNPAVKVPGVKWVFVGEYLPFIFTSH
jgi:hypothetical protein